MMKQKKKVTKLIIAIMALVLLIICTYVIVNVIRISNVLIGKTLYINFEAGDADYLEMLLEEENADDPSNKVILLNREEVEKLIQYMRDNGVQITPGEYKIPQTSKYEDLLSILKFESEKSLTNFNGEILFVEEQDVYKIDYDAENNMYYVFWYNKDGNLVGVTNSWERLPTIEKMESGLWRFSANRGTSLCQEVYFDEDNGWLSGDYYYVVGVSEEYIAYLVYDYSENNALIWIGDIFSREGYELLIDRQLGWIDSGNVEVEFLDNQSLRLIYESQDGISGNEIITWK